jgi:ATP adenylyltransferase
MNEFPENLWSPWRMEYIESLVDKTGTGCFICDYRDTPDEDAAHRVVVRTDTSIVIMNRFPYTNGHLLVAPLAHKGDLADLSDREMTDLWHLTRDGQALLQKAANPHGFNIGINFGRCAGAGLPDHLHVHVVPRWNGDTNFMTVLGDVRVVPQALDHQYDRLRELAGQMNVPTRRE